MDTQKVITLAAFTLGAAGMACTSYYLYRNYSNRNNVEDPEETEDDSESDFDLELMDSSGQSQYVSRATESQNSQTYSEPLIKLQTWDDLRKHNLEMAIVVTTAYYKRTNSEELKQKATRLVWTLYEKDTERQAGKILSQWKLQGGRKRLYRVNTFPELDIIHDQVLKAGYIQLLLKDENRLPVALAIGPGDCAQIEQLLKNVEQIKHN
jgi:hypothetical protein